MCYFGLDCSLCALCLICVLQSRIGFVLCIVLFFMCGYCLLFSVCCWVLYSLYEEWFVSLIFHVMFVLWIVVMFIQTNVFAFVTYI